MPARLRRRTGERSHALGTSCVARLATLRVRRVEEAVRHQPSPTAVVAEALRTGLLPRGRRRPEEIPHEDQKIQVGDPDDRSLANEYVGEDTPGGTTPTPDQNSVDEIGAVYGLTDVDAGALRSGAEVLARRDRHRAELQPPRKPQL